jgi:uncharacterized membrane protein
MALIGRLHPLLIHFPIALVIGAAVAEATALITANGRWRTVAVANLRAGAVFAVLAAIAGWRLAGASVETPAILEWHRWLGALGSGTALVAAMATTGLSRRSTSDMWLYRAALFAAGALIAVTGHLGGLLVWGADFLRL